MTLDIEAPVSSCLVNKWSMSSVSAPHFSVKRHNNQVEESAWNVKSFDIEFVGANNIHYTRLSYVVATVKDHYWNIYVGYSASPHAMYHSWKHIRSIYQILELRSWSEMYMVRQLTICQNVSRFKLKVRTKVDCSVLTWNFAISGTGSNMIMAT